MKPNLKILFIFFFPIASAIVTYIILSSLFFTPYDKNDTTEKLIVVTSNAKETGKMLKNEKIIRNWWSFSTIVFLRSLKNKVTTGEYSFSPSMSPLEIVKKINTGDVILREINITGGDTVQDVINKIVNQEVTTKEQLDEKILNKQYIQALGVPSGNLEGYLFPAIYKFTRPIEVDNILKRILIEGDKNWLPIYEERSRDLKMTRREILTLASVIERECMELHIPKDIAILRDISSIYHNRLKKDLPLEAVSTLLYVNKSLSLPLSDEDKAINSSYNTFTNIGLPPSPICNPMRASIEAALYPAERKYISFSFNQNTKALSFQNENN